MALQFIFGASGAGKTEYIYRKLLKEAGEDWHRRFFLLVPEQDTLQTQQGIISHPDNAGRGIWNIDVLSFNRLAYRVFEEQGLEGFRIIDDMGKTMILRRVAEDVKKQLVLYQNQLNKPGFLSELKSQISELYQYRVMPEMVRLAAEGAASPYTKAKLGDLATLYEAFRSYLETHGYLTQEEVLDRLYACLPDSGLLRDAVVVLDGFTGFTPVQLDIIREILRQAELVQCALVTDDVGQIYEKRGMDDLFYLSRQTLEKLIGLAEELGTELLRGVDLNRYDARSGARRGQEALLPRFESVPQLDFLQRHLFRYDGAQSQVRDGIRILEAPDQRAEITAIAGQIVHAVREKGLRYRDIGMIVTDTQAYQDIIYQVFSDAGLPYFIDDGKSLLDTPYAEVIRGALEVVDESFSYEAVMRYLRALPQQGLLLADQIDCFDNLLRRRGIRGFRRFSEPWEEGEPLRQLLMPPLLALKERVSGRGISAAARVEAVYALTETLKLSEAVEKLALYLESCGEMNRAQEYRQGIAAVNEVLERLSMLLGESCVSLSEFRDILDAGLTEASVTVIPATIDRIIIGDLMRSRFASPKLFFIAGANADQIPKAEPQGRIISDRERELFASLSVELAPSGRENALIQRFYIYRALLNPSEQLVISYSMKGRGGKGQKPSGLIGDMLQLFPQLRVERIRHKKRQIYTKGEGLRFLAEQLAELGQNPALLQDRDFITCLKLLLEEDSAKEALLHILSAAFTRYTGSALDKGAAEAVYGEILRGSITRLELYNRCAYAHFLKYGLRLAERKTFEIQAFDIGNLYHGAIEACFRLAMREHKQLPFMGEEELDALVRQCVAEVAEQYDNAVMKDTARSQYLLHKVEEITRTTLWALAEQLKRGDFEVHALERDFDLIREGVRLKGRIDRIDTCEDGGRIYVKVIDYKSGRTEFDLNQIYNGLQLQLSVYLDIAMQQLQRRYPKQEILPAAMFYYHIDDPLLGYDAGRNPEDAAAERLRALRLDGLVNTDLEIVQKLDRTIEKESDVIPVSIKNGNVDETKRSVASTKRFAALQAHVREQLRRYAAEIQDGAIGVEPVRVNQNQTACTYCPYHAVCGFDRKIEGFSFKRTSKRKPEEIWQELLAEQEDEEKDGMSEETGECGKENLGPQ